MYVTREELVKTRIELAKQMNHYIIEMGDENIWIDWISFGIPDAPIEDDYRYFAETDAKWIDLCKLFGALVNADGAD